MLLIVTSGCVTQKKCNEKYPATERDSIFISTTTTIIDTVVNYVVKSDTVQGAGPMFKPSTLTNKYAVTTAYVKNDSLFHNLRAIAQELPVRVQIKYVDRVEKVNHVRIITQKYVPKFYKITAWAAGILILLCGGAIYIFKGR